MHVMRAFGRFAGVFVAGLAAVVVAAQEPRVDTGFPSGDRGSVFDVFPKVLTNAAGWKVDTASALKGKMFGLYFSAHWCGPCRGFTPQLVKFYQQVAAKSGFEIVFVSSDKTADDMRNYMTTSSMPWLAIPFDDPARQELKRRFQIRGIPSLVICGRDGKMLSANARWDVVMLGDGAVKAWEAPDYTPRTFADYRAANGSGGNCRNDEIQLAF